jgi:hypothetical protein
VLDTERAMLVWEPKRIVPSYAVPAEDVDAELIAAVGLIADRERRFEQSEWCRRLGEQDAVEFDTDVS